MVNPIPRKTPSRSKFSWFTILGVGIFIALLLETFEVTTMFAFRQVEPIHEHIPSSLHTLDSSNDSLQPLQKKRKIAICTVLLDGHIGSHKVYGDNELKNNIDAEAFVDSVGVLRLAFEEIGSQHFDLDFLAIVVDSANMRRHYDKL